MPPRHRPCRRGWLVSGREREQRGETLDEAGAATGIHPYHIDAIERGDMTRMPERMDALEMIGAYAHYLGFDPEPLVEHYAQFLPAPPLAPKAVHPANPAPCRAPRSSPSETPEASEVRVQAEWRAGGAGGLVASLGLAVFLFAASATC